MSDDHPGRTDPAEGAPQTLGDAGSAARRVVFIGGLDDGRRAVAELQHHPRVDLVGAFVLDEPSGGGVSGFRTFDDLVPAPTLHKIEKIRQHAEQIRELRPDLVLVVGFSQIIPRSILDIPPLGVIGFHSAVLPGRRGSSPLIWAMIDGLRESGITMFYIDDGIDTGDVIESSGSPSRTATTRSTCCARPTTPRSPCCVATWTGSSTAPRRGSRSAEGQSSYTRRRTPADGEIDWTRPADEVVRLIRALAPPYPVAHTFGGDGVPILIERARVAPELRLPPPRRLPHDPLRQRVLCVVAHPDDETLGVGGTLALHAEAGSEVAVLIMSEGEVEKLDEHAPLRHPPGVRAAGGQGHGGLRRGLPRLPRPAPGRGPVHRTDQGGGGGPGHLPADRRLRPPRRRRQHRPPDGVQGGVRGLPADDPCWAPGCSGC